LGDGVAAVAVVVLVVKTTMGEPLVALEACATANTRCQQKIRVCLCGLTQTHSTIKINNYLLLYLVSILEKKIGEKSILMERERLGGFLRVKCLNACESVCLREGERERGRESQYRG